MQIKKYALRHMALAAMVMFLLQPLLSAAETPRGPESAPDHVTLPPNVRYRVFVHNPHHGKPQVNTPSCSVTEPGGDQSQTYGAAGWHMSGAKTYHLNESTVPSSVGVGAAYDAFNVAWDTWGRADANIIVTAGVPSGMSRPRYDGTNLVAWGKTPGNALAVAYTWYNTLTGEMVESDVIFNSRVRWSYTPYTNADCGGTARTYDVGNIATHEFGHWIGLDDLYATADQDLTMYGYGFTTELKKVTLGLGDVIGAAAITP